MHKKQQNNNRYNANEIKACKKKYTQKNEHKGKSKTVFFVLDVSFKNLKLKKLISKRYTFLINFNQK